MPPASRPRDAPSALRRALLLIAALSVGAVAGSVALPGASSASRVARSAHEAGSTLSLAGQTSWVRGRSGLELQLRISSSLPVSRLGLKFVLYSRLTSRSAFVQSVAGTEPASELPVDAPSLIPLSALDHRGSATGSVTIKFPVETAPTTPTRSLTSPRLDLSCADQCDGVYPLEAALVDASTGNVLATLTTHLIYTAGTAGSLPLNVSLVIPSGTIPALGTAGGALLSTTRLRSLQEMLGAMAAQPATKVTLELYPQLLVALERDPSKLAKTVLASLETLLGRQGTTPPSTSRQVLGATFAPVDATALESAGLGGELSLQLARGIQALNTGLGRSVEATPYVSYAGLDRRSLALLEQDGIRQVVVPSVTTPAGTPVPTVALTSPFTLLAPATGTGTGAGTGSSGSQGQQPTSSANTPVALVADPGLAAHFAADPGDPELAAHQLLADLAEIYFDAPSDQDPRGVVVAPAGWVPNASFLTAVLSGLADSPILGSLPLGQAFQLPIGGNGSPRQEQLAPVTTSNQQGLTTSPVVTARRELGVVKSVLAGDKTLLSRLGDAILIGESTGLSSGTRRTYDSAPHQALDKLRSSLTITEGKAVTLTSRTGQIPINIVSTSRYPIQALIELRDSALDFSHSGTRSKLVTFSAKITSLDYRVSTRTSGASRLDVVVVSPKGDVTLLSGSFTIRSTAVSGVAVALSIGALLVLAAWWLRSVLRHRRRAAQSRAAAPSGDESTAIA
ncbi:MAG: hypothetical protein JWO62_2412 [Acidimicrobiaceae bacterium]|nr:hypothetical protein [Acidimicrobiaceae bacterium]